MRRKNLHIWDGVYNDWDSAPADDNVFNNDVWLKKITVTAKKDLDIFQNENPSFSNFFSRDSALPVVCSMAIKLNKPLTIIDYGGGLGSSYFPVASAIDHPINYYIVEKEAVCERGKELFKNVKEMYFYSDLSELKNLQDKIDIIHLGSSFQYINDQQKLLKNIADLQPSYLLMADMLAGDIKSFISIQNFYGKKIRVRFSNINELLNLVRKFGFSLLYKTSFINSVLGKEEKLPMGNFDKIFRLNYPCQLLFKYNGKIE